MNNTTCNGNNVYYQNNNNHYARQQMRQQQYQTAFSPYILPPVTRPGIVRVKIATLDIQNETWIIENFDKLLKIGIDNEVFQKMLLQSNQNNYNNVMHDYCRRTRRSASLSIAAAFFFLIIPIEMGIIMAKSSTQQKVLSDLQNLIKLQQEQIDTNLEYILLRQNIDIQIKCNILNPGTLASQIIGISIDFPESILLLQKTKYPKFSNVEENLSDLPITNINNNNNKYNYNCKQDVYNDNDDIPIAEVVNQLPSKNTKMNPSAPIDSL